MDAMFVLSMVSFFGLVVSWLALPASKAAPEPSRVVVSRRRAAVEA